VLNRAAEDAVKEGLLYLWMVTKMSFADARGILMGNESSATNYLQNSTYRSIREVQSCNKNSFTK
jgi:hypothetical protein